MKADEALYATTFDTSGAPPGSKLVHQSIDRLLAALTAAQNHKGLGTEDSFSIFQ